MIWDGDAAIRHGGMLHPCIGLRLACVSWSDAIMVMAHWCLGPQAMAHACVIRIHSAYHSVHLAMHARAREALSHHRRVDQAGWFGGAASWARTVLVNDACPVTARAEPVQVHLELLEQTAGHPLVTTDVSGSSRGALALERGPHAPCPTCVEGVGSRDGVTARYLRCLLAGSVPVGMTRITPPNPVNSRRKELTG